jgi:hypothetical protein
MNTQSSLPPLSFVEARTHFGIWYGSISSCNIGYLSFLLPVRCTLSAPLTLGFDVRNSTTMDFAWPIITNTEAIAVNQDWAKFPGMLFTTVILPLA